MNVFFCNGNKMIFNNNLRYNPLEVIICGKCVVNFYHNISFIVLLYERILMLKIK